MNKVKFFLVSDGALILVAVVFFLFLFLRKNRESGFRDDLWAEKKKKLAEDRKRAFEDQVDKQILLDHKPDPRDPEEKPTAQREFRVPNFHGRAHEILGVPQGAPRDLVLRAYKHWIKRYHPDRVSHLGGKYVEQARRRAEQLNSARDELLKTAK
jgi:DnaJ-domain-containing protein 1